MKRAKGFTIIELVVIIVIMGILALIAIPGFSRWLPNYRLRAATRDLFSNIQHTKLTAIKRHRTCAITFNRNAGGTIDGYVVYVDTITNLEFDDPGDEVLANVVFSERYDGVLFDTSKGGGDGIDDTIIDNDDNNPTIGFLSNGFSIGNDGNAARGSVYLKTNATGRERQVAVSAAGNITIIE